MKPVIGITTFCEKGTNKIFNSVSYNYVKSIMLAGGVPMLIPLDNDTDNFDIYLEKVDGLLFSGGVDVSPMLYGEDPLKEITKISSDRDNYEINLLNKAVSMDMPILGICRGMQLINVALEGSLYQDINAQIKNSNGHSPSEINVDELYHSVSIKIDSRLFKILNKDKIFVNSFHHQCVKKLGKNLKPVAFSSDNIVEAYESSKHRFLLGVQWHPEDLVIKHREFLQIFKELVEESSK